MNYKTIAFLLLLMITSINFIGQVNIIVYSKFEDFEKKEIKSADKNKVKIINFWATWCVPCVKELPYFEAIDGTIINGTSIEVTLASLDFEKNLKTRVIPFVEKKKLKSKVVLMADGNANKWINKIDKGWSGAIPATYIIYNGKHYFFEKDYHSLLELKTEVETIINNNKK